MSDQNDPIRTMSTSDLVYRVATYSDSREAAAELDRRIPEPTFCAFVRIGVGCTDCGFCGGDESAHPRWVYR